MSDQTLNDIYKRIIVDIVNVNENSNSINDELNILYKQINVDIVNVNENTNSINAELDRFYSHINVEINDESVQGSGNGTSNVQSSNKINNELNELYNKINVVIDDKSTPKSNEDEGEGEEDEQNKINDTFEIMLNEQGFNAKLIKYMYNMSLKYLV